MRDMTPRSDRSIRNIPVPANHRRPVPPVEMDEEEEGEPVRPARSVRRTRSGRGKWIIIAVIVVAIASILAIMLSTMFAGATITVFPRQETVAAPASIVARMSAPVGSLSYQTATISRSATTTVPASGTKQVSRQASGLITIYNTYSSETQRLIANTRFEASDGKIFRIHDSVVVPGMSDGSPGTASITVYADSPGAEYNRGETRFTIPGFKGDPRYAKFYAETKSISGGFVGTEPAVAAADLSAAQSALQKGLQAAVQSALLSEIQEGFMPLTSTLKITYANISQTSGVGNNAQLSQSAQATVFIVREHDLASAIAAAVVQSYKGEAVALADPSQVIIAVATTTKTTDGSLTLQLSGTPTLVWQYDPAALIAALLGKNKGSFQQIIQSFEPAIMRAEAKIRPFWKTNFPSTPEKIQIEKGNES